MAHENLPKRLEGEDVAMAEVPAEVVQEGAHGTGSDTASRPWHGIWSGNAIADSGSRWRPMRR